MKNRALLIAATLAITCCDAQAVAETVHESVFKDFWIAPGSSDERGADKGGDFRLMISRWHRAVAGRSPSHYDRQREAVIASQIETFAAGANVYSHRRVTCRSKICEYVVILKKSVSFGAGNRLVAQLQGAGDQICRMADGCEKSVVMSGGGPKGDGVAMLMYLVSR